MLLHYGYKFILVFALIYILLKKHKGHQTFLYEYILLYGVINDVIWYYLNFKSNIQAINTHCYMLVINLYLCGLYNYTTDNRKRKLALNILLALNFLLSLYLLFFTKDFIFESYNVVVLNINAVFCMITSLFFLANFLVSDKVIFIFKEFTFWLAFGLFIWSIFFLLKMGLYLYFYKSDDYMFHFVTDMFRSVNITFYLLIIKGISCLKPKK